MSRGTQMREVRISSLRDGGYIVFDSSAWISSPGLDREPVFACSSKDDLLDYLEKRLAEHQPEEED